MVKLGEVTSKIGSGATPRGGSGVYEATGTAFIRSQNVFDHSFSYSGLARISDAAAFALKNVSVERNDVLICITGESVTRSAKVPESALPARVSQHVAIVRADGQRLESAFLQQVLLAPVTKAILSTLSEAGATRRALTKGHLESLLIPLPPLDEQRRIAEVLGALDDLIDTNERLADQLMELARTLTRGASESVVPLIELAEIAPFRTVTPIGGTAHYSLPAFDNGAMPECLDGGGIKSNKILIESSVTLISRLNPHIPRVWAVYPDADVMNVASTEFVPVRGVGVSTEEVYAVVSSDAYLAQLSSRVTGTTGSHQRVDKRALLDLSVPDLRLLQPDVRVAIREVVQEAHASRVICAKLRRTRDELLPLLMSGKVRARPEGVSA
jgi:type I restriction enzyme S subunit